MALRTLALIVAAGDSRRFGGDVPKPYTVWNGKTVLRRTVETFATHPQIDSVRVVIRRADHGIYKKTMNNIDIFPCVVGGASRQESVRRGLESVERHAPKRVLIHDAARPLVSHALINRVLAALDHAPAAFPALPVADTLRKETGGIVPREGLLIAQTPQGFDYTKILAAHRQFANSAVTDDIALAELADLPVEVVPGERRNFKLTLPEDFALMQALTPMETRIGTGFDVHAFTQDTSPQSHIMLCGVAIPHTHRLEGHSDADVGLHALVDALLGTIGAGDIGEHFSPNDPCWKGADSAQFVRHAYQLLTTQGGKIVNIDITLIGEAPKVAPHRQHMITKLAEILTLSPSRISVKATTTEKLGFTGRKEGLAAQAAVTVQLPCL